MQHTDCNCSRDQFLVGGSRQRQTRQLRHSQRPSEDCWSRLGERRRNAIKPVNTLPPEVTIYLLDSNLFYMMLSFLSVLDILNISAVSKKFRVFFNDFHEVISEKIYLYIWKRKFPGQVGFSEPIYHLDVTYDGQTQIFEAKYGYTLDGFGDIDTFDDSRRTIQWDHCNALPPFLRKGQKPFCSALATSHLDRCSDEDCEDCKFDDTICYRHACHCNCPHCTGSESTVKQLGEIKAHGCPQCHTPFGTHSSTEPNEHGVCSNCNDYIHIEEHLGFHVFTCKQCPLPDSFQRHLRETYPIQFCSACWNGVNPDFEDRRLCLNQDTFELEFNLVGKELFQTEFSNLRMSGLLSQMKQHFVLFRWERILRGFCDKGQIRFW